MDCKDCIHAKVALPVDSSNGKIKFTGELKLRCAQGHWLKDDGTEKSYRPPSLSAVNKLLLQKSYNDHNCIDFQ